jgi:hypothetical protein
MKDRLFKAKWAAVLESGRASIEMKLVEAANKAFDPDELEIGEAEPSAGPPKVSVAEAIRIVQLHGSKAQREEQQDFLAQQAAEMSADDVDGLRERLIRKLKKLREREMSNRLAEGWSHDESYDHLVPPGWVKGPEYKPKEVERGVDADRGREDRQ